MLNVLDLVLAVVFLASNQFLVSLNIIRLPRIAIYYSETRGGWLLSEIGKIFKKTFPIVISIVGILILILIFFSLLVHHTWVFSVHQFSWDTTSRCRFSTKDRQFKIDDTLNYLCQADVPSYTCPPDEQCLTSNSDILVQFGIRSLLKGWINET